MALTDSLRKSFIAILMVPAILTASAITIDYSHTVMGSGTVLTDYAMGNPQSNEAVASLRGTGDLMDRYTFSANSTSNFSVANKFVLSKGQNSTGMAIEEVERDFPRWPESPGSFRFTGTEWADKVVVQASSDSNPILIMPEGQLPVPSDVSGFETLATVGNYEFGGTTRGVATPATAYTQITNSTDFQIESSLLIGNDSFSYESGWSTDSKVAVRSAVGENQQIVHETDAWISGNASGRKQLEILQ